MVKACEDNYDPLKAELDSTTTVVPSPPSQHTQPLPLGAHEHGSYSASATLPELSTHELALSDDTPPPQPSKLDSTPSVPVDSNIRAPTHVDFTVPTSIDYTPTVDTESTTSEHVHLATEVPIPCEEEEQKRLEQLRVQRAVVTRDRARKEKIERMRAEEERLDSAIADLESSRN
jgi:hypothetical protein